MTAQVGTPVTIDLVGTPGGPAAGVPDECRAWLTRLADVLIPASATMPAASSVGVGGRQLDIVLRSRPDLAHHLLRAWAMTAEDAPGDAIRALQDLDAAAFDAVRLAVAGGYYTSTDVREKLGYTGQQPRTVRIAEDIDEDLLMRVVERGPRFRPA